MRTMNQEIKILIFQKAQFWFCFCLNFYFEVIIDSHMVAKVVQEGPMHSVQFPASDHTHFPTPQHPDQDIDTGTMFVLQFCASLSPV